MTTPNLTPEAMQARSIAITEYESGRKKGVAAWLLWLFLGGLGGHRYYLGDTTQAIFMTITLGGLGFWTLIDAFFINRRIRSKNMARWAAVAGRYSTPLEPSPEGTK